MWSESLGKKHVKEKKNETDPLKNQPLVWAFSPGRNLEPGLEKCVDVASTNECARVKKKKECAAT
jgi:hypothetical protein